MLPEEAGVRAFILDLLSVSFAYPTEDLYQSLLDGSYAEELEQRVLQLPHAEGLIEVVKELAAYRDSDYAVDFDAFQSEYISLFEYNKEVIALHLNAHLYSKGVPQPVAVYQRLNSMYRDFDIEMATDKATEQPDHLSVQLEFFAFLYRLLMDDEKSNKQKFNETLASMCKELQWTSCWYENLSTRSAHAFYHPLSKFLLQILEMFVMKAVISC